jgi:hypothetical protein
VGVRLHLRRVGSGFAGASIARFSNNRIVALHEYKMTHAPFEWEPPQAS